MLTSDENLNYLETPGDSNEPDWLEEPSGTPLAASLLSLVEDLPDLDVDDDIHVEDSDEIVRSDSVNKTLSVLRSDAERADGELLRTDLERQCFRRKLSVAECIEIERCLVSDGVVIIENDDDAAVANSSEPTIKIVPLGGPTFLSESDEKELGRKIQLALRAGISESSNDEPYISRLRKEAALAKVRFVESNIRYVRKTAAHFAYTKHLNGDDLFQEGVLGLLRATESYDPEMGFRFKTYATWWINQKIHRAIADSDRTVRLPVHVVEKIKAIRKATRTLSGPNGEEPELDLVARALGMETQRLAEFMWTVAATECTDGDAPVGEGTAGDGNATTFSFIADTQTPSPFDITYRRELNRLIKERLKKREARILFLRFGLGNSGEHTLEEIGAKFGLTRERVRQIQDKALDKLKPVFQRTVYEKAIDHGGVYRTWGR
ncbi:sigma-70 family RNA polymerase sigma factor [Edaphobacter sp.]|uniref:sigma-70 family RNA polymerase sigma factor n=1 Tax=Edaphobacter sp. TaxID=1934404 RepID=UPI002DBFB6C4|nr:sigma-70 family RNA polymerase sigma factor [Edaphobacter sp.]HEU5342410.1 sigma-70 family RNA polymerase sigma factor [Edaphobacter sp.]